MTPVFRYTTNKSSYTQVHTQVCSAFAFCFRSDCAGLQVQAIIQLEQNAVKMNVLGHIKACVLGFKRNVLYKLMFRTKSLVALSFQASTCITFRKNQFNGISMGEPKHKQYEKIRQELSRPFLLTGKPLPRLRQIYTTYIINMSITSSNSLLIQSIPPIQCL